MTRLKPANGLKASVCLVLAILACAGCGQKQDFRSRAAPLRVAWTILSTNDDTISHHRLATAGRLLRHDVAERDRAMSEYLAARRDYLDGRRDIRSANWDRSVIVEQVFLLREVLVSQPSAKANRPSFDVLGRLMPAHIVFAESIGIQPDIRRLVTPSPPAVPGFFTESMLEASSLLEEAGLYDLAWREQLAGAYLKSAPPTFGESINNSSLCPSIAPLWLKTARLARLARRDDVAWRLLMKAAIFGDESLYESSLSLAEEWEKEDALAEKTGKPRPEPEPIPLDTRREALTQAVRLCAECNAHPRGWALIDAHPELFDDPAALRKEVTDGWQAIVDKLVDYLPRYTGPERPKTLAIYGTKVYPDGDPLAVNIPRPFSDEAMEYARKRMREIRNRPAKRTIDVSGILGRGNVLKPGRDSDDDGERQDDGKRQGEAAVGAECREGAEVASAHCPAAAEWADGEGVLRSAGRK